MPDAIGNTKDLDASRTDALQGLLSSLGYTNDGSSSGATLSTERRRNLSEKINEILGDRADRDLTLGGQPSQLLNEYGLSIIDISEPVNLNEDSQTNTSPSPFLEQDLTSFSLFPPDERERRRRERDRVLDLLEEEERLQQLQEERDAEEERKEAIRKRKESAKAELDRLKAARELQKKMGEALVQHAKGTEENRQDENARLKPQIASSAAKKRVSFADAPIVKADERDQQMSICQPDWGDVTPGRLRAQSRIPLVSTAEAQKYPMKIRVVERRPTATATSPFHNDPDSDDESTSSAGNLSSHMENDSSDEGDRSPSSNNGLSDDEPLEEGLEYDTAQHYRQIALEYHKKRHAIGAETARAMAAHTLDDYEQHETSNGQVPLSRFRADRMAAAYDKSHGPVSTSIGQTVIPASRQKSLRNSVRLGKLENDQLIGLGGDSGESGSEDETVKEVIQMLQTGRIQNAGPDFKLSSMTTIAPPKNSDAVESLSVGTPTTAHGAKPSRFKLARGGGNTETTTFQDSKSGDKARSQPAVLSVVERKAPRSSPSQIFPINKPPLRSPVKISEPAPPMIIDSPSFPMTASTSTITIPSSTPRPMTIGSSSRHQTQLERPPLVKSSGTQDSAIQSRVSPRDPLAVERPISKFMTERK